MATVIHRNGRDITLYNPAERSKKYCDELKAKVHVAGKKQGQDLTNTEAAYRAGYLEARRESAKIWCKKNGVPSKAKSRRRSSGTSRSVKTKKKG